MSKEAKPATSDRQHQIEVAKLDIDRTRALTESKRADTDRIKELMAIVQYLNGQQEGEQTTVAGTYETTTVVTKSRSLNCHEEDILNASLIQLKRAIGFR